MNSKKRIIEQIPVKRFVEDHILRIDLDADYQREKIWTRKNQEELLDSLLHDIDIPKLYLARASGGSFDFECIDGKQRMSALLAFFKPSPDDEPLAVRVAGHKYSYGELKTAHPSIARAMEEFELTVVTYPEVDEDLIREIFRRLQLGVRLNSGEMLKSFTGSMRDFVFKEMGSAAPFLQRTALSEKRYSRQFTLAQICINSFRRTEYGEFVRARFNDLQDFFGEKARLSPKDEGFARIRRVLAIMDRDFAGTARSISSRAVAVTAFLFVEDLVDQGKTKLVAKFAEFYGSLLASVDEELGRLSRYEQPKNLSVLDEFQKYISQASVEPYAIKRRHEFLKREFAKYRSSRRTGRSLKSS